MLYPWERGVSLLNALLAAEEEVAAAEEEVAAARQRLPNPRSMAVSVDHL